MNDECVKYSSDCVRREVKSSKSIKYDSIVMEQSSDEICVGWRKLKVELVERIGEDGIGV